MSDPFGIEIYEEIKLLDNKYDLFPEVTKEKVDQYIRSLISFGIDGPGGHFLLLFYADSDEEPVVIFLGSEGEAEFLAQSFDDYILTMRVPEQSGITIQEKIDLLKNEETDLENDYWYLGDLLAEFNFEENLTDREKAEFVAKKNRDLFR